LSVVLLVSCFTFRSLPATM